MPKVKCLDCGRVADVEEVERTASSAVLRFRCCRTRSSLGVLVSAIEPPAQLPLSVEEDYPRSAWDAELPESSGNPARRPGDGVSSERQPEAAPTVVTLVPPPGPPSAVAAGDAGSAAAARKWTEAEVRWFDDAVKAACVELPDLTTDDVWARLPRDFPVTKGSGSRMKAAARAGWLEATDQMRASQRLDEHGHAQRLTVWRSLRYVAERAS